MRPVVWWGVLLALALPIRGDTLTLDHVRDPAGNTAAGPWQFWFELAHQRGAFERLDTHSKAIPKEGVPRKITGPIAGLLPNPGDSVGWLFHSDWDGRFEGVWADAKLGAILLSPYAEKTSHLAVAITYRVPADGVYDISGELTDLQVTPEIKQHDGIDWWIEIAETGKAGRKIGQGGPLGDGNGRPDSEKFHLKKIELKKGQLVRLVVHPRKWWGSDVTRLDGFTIKPSE